MAQGPKLAAVTELKPRRRRASPEVQATLKLTKAIEAATDRFGPAADTIVGFGARLDLLCAWLKKWGPWALASVPFIATLIGGLSPNAAEAIGKFLKAYTG